MTCRACIRRNPDHPANEKRITEIRVAFDDGSAATLHMDRQRCTWNATYTPRIGAMVTFKIAPPWITATAAGLARIIRQALHFNQVERAGRTEHTE